MTQVMRKDALISEDGLYRYWLTREWSDENRRKVGFIMLNPSTADATEDDPTIRRCIGFAQRWGYGAIGVANLFALRSSKPEVLTWTESDPVGPVNDKYILRLVQGCDLVVAAWGAHPFAAARAKEVCANLGDRLSCLGVTKAGHPKHPLYLRGDTQPIAFDPKGMR